MADGYTGAPGIARARIGTPPLLSLLALESALGAFDGVDIEAVRARSVSLTALPAGEHRGSCSPAREFASPRDDAVRGSQVAVRHPAAYGIVQALAARGVVGDFRTPDIVRLGVAAPYLTHAEMVAAARALQRRARRRASTSTRPGPRATR